MTYVPQCAKCGRKAQPGDWSGFCNVCWEASHQNVTPGRSERISRVGLVVGLLVLAGMIGLVVWWLRGGL